MRCNAKLATCQWHFFVLIDPHLVAVVCFATLAHNWWGAFQSLFVLITGENYSDVLAPAWYFSQYGTTVFFWAYIMWITALA